VEVFELWPLALFVVVGVFGLLAGSFLNVVVYRLPLMMERDWREQCAELLAQPETPLPPHAGATGRFNLWWPPSACPGCGRTVAAWQNIPVLSYLLLRGRCAGCQAPISRRYPIVETAAAVTGVIVALTFGPTWQTVAALGFTWTLLAASLIDADTKLLPDSLTLPLMWAGIVLSLFVVNGEPMFFVDLQSSVIGAAAGYLSLWLVYHAFKLITGKEGMGYGDFKLLAALGAWLGWQMLPLIILLSAAVGAVIGIALIAIQGRSRHATLPFGPYLAGAGWIALLWGRDIVDWYLGMYTFV
jgi:leader peptidase (prepilin peptidase) / N-methyltransferase